MARYHDAKESHGGKMDPKKFKEHRMGEEPKYADHMVEDREYARRTQHMQDGGMIHSDFNEIANLPQGVMMKQYPKAGPYLPEDLDDTIAGVDRQMDYDDGKRKQNFYPKKV